MVVSNVMFYLAYQYAAFSLIMMIFHIEASASSDHVSWTVDATPG